MIKTKKKIIKTRIVSSNRWAYYFDYADKVYAISFFGLFEKFESVFK